MPGAYWLFRPTDISLCAGICIYQIRDCRFVTGVSRTVRRHPSSRHNIPRVRQATTGANPQTPAQCQGNARHPCIDPVLAQQTRGLDLMLFQCWTSAVGGGPTMKQFWVISSCLLGGGGGLTRTGWRIACRGAYITQDVSGDCIRKRALINILNHSTSQYQAGSPRGDNTSMTEQIYPPAPPPLRNWSKAGIMLVQRRLWWVNFKPTFSERLMFTGG